MASLSIIYIEIFYIAGLPYHKQINIKQYVYIALCIPFILFILALGYIYEWRVVHLFIIALPYNIILSFKRKLLFINMHLLHRDPRVSACSKYAIRY